MPTQRTLALFVILVCLATYGLYRQTNVTEAQTTPVSISGKFYKFDLISQLGQNDIADFYFQPKRLSFTQRRFLKAVETLAKVKRLLSEADYREQQAKHKRGQATLASQQLLKNLTR